MGWRVSHNFQHWSFLWSSNSHCHQLCKVPSLVNHISAFIFSLEFTISSSYATNRILWDQLGTRNSMIMKGIWISANKRVWWRPSRCLSSTVLSSSYHGLPTPPWQQCKSLVSFANFCLETINHSKAKLFVVNGKHSCVIVESWGLIQKSY